MPACIGMLASFITINHDDTDDFSRTVRRRGRCCNNLPPGGITVIERTLLRVIDQRYETAQAFYAAMEMAARETFTTLSEVEPVSAAFNCVAL